jgi:hypothetical protein
MINIEDINERPYYANIKEGSDSSTVEKFLRLLEVKIHNLRIQNDDSGDTSYLKGAINEFLKMYDILRPKPEKKKEK